MFFYKGFPDVILLNPKLECFSLSLKSIKSTASNSRFKISSCALDQKWARKSFSRRRGKVPEGRMGERLNKKLRMESTNMRITKARLLRERSGSNY